jgi:hypothetical protein
MTIFSVQRFLEDHFERRGLTDVDQYAVRVANTFERIGSKVSDNSLAAELRHVRTAFFRRNHDLNRKEFELQLAAALRRRFKKKTLDPATNDFERGLAPTRARLRAQRRSIGALLSEFKLAVEARAVDGFWDSRTKRRLRAKPEKIAQSLLAVFAKGILGADALVLREIASGIGFVDVGISFGRVLHLIELKILKTRVTGPNQLATYMRTERRKSGWLLLIDVRGAGSSDAIPAVISTSAGRIRTLTVDVNPPAPHDM